MDHFTYKDGVLHAEEIAISEIAQHVPTPFYLYSSATLERHFNVMKDAFSSIPTLICFAVKANSNQAVLTTLAKLGAGADTVSEGEIRRAIAAGIPPNKIIFSGVGKTRDEIHYALTTDILQFSVESIEELHLINEIAGTLGKKAPISIRVNPDVDAGSHDKISTGRKTDKFGVAWNDIIDAYETAGALENLNIVGVNCHIGSQLTQLTPFKTAFDKIVGLVTDLREKGHNIVRLDLGGGLGIPYERTKETPPHPTDYANMIIDTIKDLGCELALEPGRLIAGNAGILVSSVIRIKQSQGRNFVIVDAAMNDLARPSLYDSFHEVDTIIEPASTLIAPVDIVGPVCETADRFARQIPFPTVKEGDLIAFRSAGAYGAVMSSTYNSRLLIPEIMVNKNNYAVIRPRLSYDDLIALDQLPEWLS